ncbi:MAG TPA: hypothetical protein VHS08_08070, partial [Candidatus Acidoferrales bacterium]|nr:hypothetical protein [Candidatus Acidoferrales bacterium]
KAKIPQAEARATCNPRENLNEARALNDSDGFGVARWFAGGAVGAIFPDHIPSIVIFNDNIDWTRLCAVAHAETF